MPAPQPVQESVPRGRRDVVEHDRAEREAEDLPAVGERRVHQLRGRIRIRQQRGEPVQREVVHERDRDERVRPLRRHSASLATVPDRTGDVRNRTLFPTATRRTHRMSHRDLGGIHRAMRSCMDRELPASEIRSAKRRRLVVGAAVLLAGRGGYWALGAWVRPTVDRRDLRLAQRRNRLDRLHAPSGRDGRPARRAAGHEPRRCHADSRPAPRGRSRRGRRADPGARRVGPRGRAQHAGPTARHQGKRAPACGACEPAQAGRPRGRSQEAAPVARVSRAKREQTEQLSEDGLASQRGAAGGDASRSDLAQETLDSLRSAGRTMPARRSKPSSTGSDSSSTS